MPWYSDSDNENAQLRFIVEPEIAFTQSPPSFSRDRVPVLAEFD